MERRYYNRPWIAHSFLRSSARQAEIIALLRATWSSANRPATTAAAVNRFVELFADKCRRHRQGEDVAGRRVRPAPALRVPAARASAEAGQILALGHSDTVWPLGTLATMPFREAEGRLWGPGVLDMKAGLVFFVFAMRGAARAGHPGAPDKVVLQLNSDEEVGSETSRALTEEALAGARRCWCWSRARDSTAS